MWPFPRCENQCLERAKTSPRTPLSEEVVLDRVTHSLRFSCCASLSSARIPPPGVHNGAQLGPIPQISHTQPLNIMTSHPQMTKNNMRKCT